MFLLLSKCHLIKVLQNLIELNPWKVRLRLVLLICLSASETSSATGAGTSSTSIAFRVLFGGFASLVRDLSFPDFVPSAL
jgi:hypothetical protein